MARRNFQRSWMAAALSVVVAMAAGLLTVRPVPAGAAERRILEITVSDSGFNPSTVPDAYVNDVLMFTLRETTDRHTVTFEDHSACPGDRGAEPCWPELRFDDGNPNCVAGQIRLPGRRCMIVMEPGKTVRYHDAFNPAAGGEVKVLGQPTTTTGPSTTTSTAPPSTTSTTRPTTTTTQSPTTVTTALQTTTSTAPTQIRPFAIPDPSSTTSTIPAVTLSNSPGTTTPPANKGKDKPKDKGKSKATEAETPTTVSSAPADAMPPDAVFDPATLTPGPGVVPDAPGGTVGVDDVDLASSAVMNLLDGEESANHWPVLLALCVLAFLVLVGGIWAWFHRASRYDPA